VLPPLVRSPTSRRSIPDQNRLSRSSPRRRSRRSNHSGHRQVKGI
jgi:hypothetical protein